jgi:hypothetical protein
VGLLTSWGLGGAAEPARANSITGELLSFVEAVEDVADLGLGLKQIQNKMLVSKIAEYKRLHPPQVSQTSVSECLYICLYYDFGKCVCVCLFTLRQAPGQWVMRIVQHRQHQQKHHHRRRHRRGSAARACHYNNRIGSPHHPLLRILRSSSRLTPLTL